MRVSNEKEAKENYKNVVGSDEYPETEYMVICPNCKAHIIAMNKEMKEIQYLGYSSDPFIECPICGETIKKYDMEEIK